jgi:uncharacterized protein (TIGR02271 family)
MIGTDHAQNLLSNGGQVLDQHRDKIGKAGQVYLDDRTGEPAWVTVKTGLFGGAESFVPLAEGRMEGDDVSVPYSKDQVKDAPRIEDENGHLSRDEEAELYRYYGLADPDHAVAGGRDTAYADTGRADDGHTDAARPQGAVGGGAGHDTSGPDTDSAMTRSEERVDVGTETETVGRARLRKYVVTENVTKTVPVSHEEVRIEREPITDANRGEALSGGDITEEEHEVELKGERVVVDKDTVPVERVQMGTETVTENREVSEQVRKEQIEADTDVDGTDSPETRRP